MGKAASSILILLILISINGFSQESSLNKRISIQSKNHSIEYILNDFQQKTELNFSYNPDHFEIDKVISFECYNLKIQDALIQLLGQDIELKVISSNLIIRSTNKIKEVKKYKYDITGIVYDSYTKEKLSEVTIYQVDGVRTALTTKDGKYTMKVVSNKEFIELTYSKKDYVDEVIIIKPSENQNFEIKLQPELKEITPKKVSEIQSSEGRKVDSSRLVKVLVPKRQNWLLENLPFLGEPQPIQLSLLPTIGTNQVMNATMENKVSINILAGYSRAVDGVEFGGLLNIVREDVKGAQFAGFGNLVGGNIEGVQAGGFFNNVKGSLNGGQFAGFSNIALDSVEGVQAAGFMNIANKNVNGGQLAGYLNIAGKNVDGVQASGFLNIARDTLKKVQIAGFANYAKYVEGCQISGFINVAKKVKGIQFGVVNIADSVDGATIGIFNLVRHGYHPIEIGATEYGSMNLRWKTGTRAFYNIIEAGIDYQNQDFWHYNYGFGHSFKLKEKRSYLDLELTAGVINPNDGFNKDFNLLNRFEMMFSYRLVGPVYIFVGPALNGFIYENDFISPFTHSNEIYKGDNKSITFDSWFGYRFGLRI